MLCGRKLGTPTALLCLMVMAAACAALKPQPPPDVSYIIPPVTYFRDNPGYASANVATVYRGQQVKVLSEIPNDWCRVETVPGGQVGWIQRPLLSPVPIPAVTYTVTATEVPLRDRPQKEAVAPPGTAVSPPAPPPSLYVAVTHVDLHLLPLSNSQVVKTLTFHDRVEKVAQSGAEWLKVRCPGAGAQGWVLAPTLSEFPLQTPTVFPPPRKRRPLKKPHRVRRAGPEEAPQPAPSPEEITPQAM
jgi:hypothetical protein